ncbi:N-methyl-L-tryptophan oxidase [Gracilariopsis chorda]|uniref:N-methyl-L-tryptophan oxidase n=1 Tax=Gracilariopsis chorda TaxID=448386 RepID=A0A2V3IIE6_9FLOR|nr:N-methyl-L-tryptophan oxidase [Gracilariopsis chorda]|eukprot:PXF41875.1 N-methyl-L-tryptophan oxidase [Gracilariopsis chorda]
MLDLQYSPYHVTPSQDFVLGHLPGLQHVLLFCGGSGRAFKFAPLLGACLSDLVYGKSARIDISRFEPRKVIQTSPKKLRRTATEVQRTERKVLGKSHGPFGEKERGVNSLVTQGCFDVFNRFQSLIAKDFENSIPYEPLADSQRLLVTLYDFGAADGGTSLQLWNDIIRKCMELCPDHEIEMKYEDQPNADYQSLFYYMQGLLQVPGRTVETYLQSEFADKVFVSAVDIALPSGVLHHTQLHESDETVGAWARVAAEDWERILMARAAELKSGGRMMIISLCVDEDGQSLGKTTVVPRSMFDEMAHHWRTMMVDGLISKEEFDRMEVVNYYRSLKEITSVLLDESSEVYRAGLRLETATTSLTPCLYWAQWIRDGGEAEIYAKNLTLTMRSWSNSSFASGLDNSRSGDDIAGICDAFFSRFAKAVAEKPNEHGMDYVHAYISVRKL